MWYLIVFGWFALIAAIFWFYRRKHKRVAVERTKAMDALIVEAKMSAGSAIASAPADAPAGAPAAVAPLAVATAEGYSRKSKLLGKADAWLYLLFRTGLPDHEIFANVALADVVEPTPALLSQERGQTLSRLAQSFLNIVVCNKQLEIVAVVLYSPTDARVAATQNFSATCLKAAGIRIVRIDAAALPRHHQLRDLVYGVADS